MHKKLERLNDVALELADMFSDFVMCGDIQTCPKVSAAIASATSARTEADLLDSIAGSVALLKKFIGTDQVYVDQRVDATLKNARAALI